jgi:hypothetical protein
VLCGDFTSFLLEGHKSYVVRSYYFQLSGHVFKSGFHYYGSTESDKLEIRRACDFFLFCSVDMKPYITHQVKNVGEGRSKMGCPERCLGP